VWRSLLFAAALFIVYEVYFTNPGVMAKEYLAQVETIAIIVFLVWRVETLQTLQTLPLPLPVREGSEYSQGGYSTAELSTPLPTKERQDRNADGKQAERLSTPLPHREGQGESLEGLGVGLETLLLLYCEQPLLYLQHDLSLSQLAEKVGTSREALGAWFAEHDDTYNAYINRLRIDHFVSLYREAVAAGRKPTVFEVAYDCGYRSDLSFTTAFRQRMGVSVAAWLKSEGSK
jgi:AraC-like DNA-binding protein